jgi:pyruvate kinase
VLIATITPHIDFGPLLVAHPSIEALRFNTITPQGNRTKKELLEELLGLCGSKPLWVDLKGRQLRIVRWGDPNYTTVDISHKISVDLPTRIYFKDQVSMIVDIVGGNRLILADAPDRPVGAGEPVNILDPSLNIEGFLTTDDVKYIYIAKRLGLHNFMLSFVERPEDIQEVLSIDSKAKVIAKIESRRGLSFVSNEYRPDEGVRLMAARDDLYINMGDHKEDILEAQERIVKADPSAIAASRILTSMENDQNVSLSDLADLKLLSVYGYEHFMLSDQLCRNRRSFFRASDMFKRYTEQIGASSES